MSLPTLTAEAIIFSINSAIRLTGRFRKAYADSLKAKRIVLPLPSFNSDPNETAIEFFFREEGKEFLGQVELLDQLHEKARTSQLTQEELTHYREFYRTFARLVHQSDDSHFVKGNSNQRMLLNKEEAIYFCKIRQWEQGTVPRSSVLQLVAGSLVEIGIDYFTQVPGALNLKSAKGIALKNFLQAMDSISFADTNEFKELTSSIVPRLFASAAETIAELSPEISGDENLQHLIKATSLGITKDLYARINRFTPGVERETTVHWGQMVLKSMIRNAGTFAFSHSSELFGTNDSASKLVAATGNALLAEILESGSEDRIDLKQVFSAQALDDVLKSAFTALSEYPDWLSKKQVVRNVLSGVSRSLASSGIQRPGLAPELVRLMFEETASNIELFWEEDAGPGQTIMISALQEMLTALGTKPAVGQWRPKLSNSQILDIVYGMTENIVQNPAWVTAKVDDQSILSKILNTTLGALVHIPPHQRFSADTFSNLLQLNIKAVAGSPKILNRVNWGTDDEEVMILDKALDLIYAFSINEKEVTPLGRIELLTELVQFSFDAILKSNPNKKGLLLLDLLLFKDTALDFSNGFNREMGNQLLASALEILDARTELVVEDHIIKNIISDTAHAIRTNVIDRQDLIPEVVRLVFAHTADNIDFVLQKKNDRSVNLLVLGLKETLQAVAAKPTTGRWKPQFSNSQLLDIVDMVSKEIVTNPEWGRNEKMISQLVGSVFTSLETVPSGKAIPNAIVRTLIQQGFRAASTQKKLLLPVEMQSGQTGQIAIQYSLEQFFITIYDDNNNEQKTWEIGNSEVIYSLVDYFMTAISTGAGDKPALDQVIGNFRKSFQDYQQNTIASIDELLITLEGMV